jgi:general secretion pathway protein C
LAVVLFVGVVAPVPARPTEGSTPAALDALSLSGVVRARDPHQSSAVLVSQGRSRALRVGESAFGARLLAVDEQGVRVERAGSVSTLRLTEAGPSTPASGAARAPSDAAAATSQVLERAEVERRLATEMPSILADTALIPVSEGGQITGFTLSRLPETGLLRDVGLQPGDVLTEVNGVPIDGLPTLISLYARLRGEPEIQATVLRGGSPVALTVRLR